MKIMKLSISYIFIFLYFLCNGHCDTTQNLDQKRNANAQSAILKFFEETGKLPSSWHELRQVEASKNNVELIEGNVRDGLKNDFIEKFRFIRNGVTIRIRGGTERVIAMSTRSLILSGAATRPKYRLMVIQLPNEGITIRQYTEEQTARLFELAGFDLADYTGPNGKWQPEPKESNSEKVRNDDNSDNDKKSSGERTGNVKTGSPDDSRDHNEYDKAPDDLSSPIILLPSLIAVVFFVLWVITRMRLRRQ